MSKQALNRQQDRENDKSDEISPLQIFYITSMNLKICVEYGNKRRRTNARNIFTSI